MDTRTEMVYRGSLVDLPTPRSRIVRVFLSSTFTDTRAERDLLMETVYPALKQYCREKHGLDFQVVDMRWGVRDEAADDHMATNLCLQEIQNCQTLSTGPKFVSLLGQRHGSPQIPPAIPSTEFEGLLRTLTENGDDTSILVTWFKQDTNAIPEMHILQPITSNIPAYFSPDQEKQTAAKQEWKTAYKELCQKVKAAAQMCFDNSQIDRDTLYRYTSSVTEIEIRRGLVENALGVDDSCLSFIRMIDDMEQNIQHPLAWRFIDLEGSRINVEAQNMLRNLRDVEIPKKLCEGNVFRSSVTWSKEGGINQSDHKDYLETFAARFHDNITQLIDNAVSAQETSKGSDLFTETVQHLQMAGTRCEVFCGREDILHEVRGLMVKASRKPIVIHGVSGCGKTSVMAKIMEQASNWLGSETVVIGRFLGTSPLSSGVVTLLETLCKHISLMYENDANPELPGALNELTKFFKSKLELATKSKPLVLVLDSLNQLSSENYAHKLNWLPYYLPEHVHIFVSTIPAAADILGILVKHVPGDNIVEVPVLGDETSLDILQALLKYRNRTLTDEQFNLAKEAFKQCSLPIYVKLVYELASTWKSYTPPDLSNLAVTVADVIKGLYARMELQHGSTLVEHALAYLTASRNGLGDGEMEDLLSLDDDVLTDVFQYHVAPVRRIPPLLWIRIQHELSNYLVAREADGIQVSYWYHSQFHEAAYARYLSDEKFRKRIHSDLADFYLGIWHGKEKAYKLTEYQMKKLHLSSPNCTADRKVASQPLSYQSQGRSAKDQQYNVRKLIQLPYNLAMAGRDRELREVCLFNYQWLLTKLRATSVQTLITDFDLLPNDQSVEILKLTLHLAKSTLNKAPETLALEIAGRLLSYLQEKKKMYDPLKGLIKDVYMSGCHDCALLPRRQCFRAPGGALKYTLEDARVSAGCHFVMSPDSRHLYVVTRENELIVWDLHSGDVEKELQLLPSGSPEGVRMNVINQTYDGRHLIIGSAFQRDINHIVILDTVKAEFAVSLNLDKIYKGIGFLDDLKFRQTNNALVVNVTGKGTDIFNRLTGDHISHLETNASMLEVDSTCSYAVCDVQRSNEVEVYNLKTYTLENRASLPHTVAKVAAAQTKPAVYVSFKDANQIMVLNLNPSKGKLGAIKKIIDMEKYVNQRITDFTLSADETLLCVTSRDSVVLWFASKLQFYRQFLIPEEAKPNQRINVLSFQTDLSADNSRLLVGYENNLVLWDVAQGKLIKTLNVAKSQITNVALTKDGGFAIVNSRRDNMITVWNLQELDKDLFQPLSLMSSAVYIDAASTGHFMSVRGSEPTESAVLDSRWGNIVCDPASGREIREPIISVDGQHLIVWEHYTDHPLQIYEVKSGKHACTIPLENLAFRNCDVGTIDKPHLLVACAEGPPYHTPEITVWDMRNGTLVARIDKDVPRNFLAVALMNDDTYVSSMHEGSMVHSCIIRVYDLSTKELVFSLDNIVKGSVQTTGNSKYIIAAEGEGQSKDEFTTLMTMWDFATGEKLRTFPNIKSLRLFPNFDGQAAFDCDGKLYDLTSGDVQMTFDNEGGYGKKIKMLRHTDPKFSSDGKYVIWLDVDGSTVLKVASVSRRQIIAKCYTHSALLSWKIAADNTVIVGCEDGRIMLLQIIDPAEDGFETKFDYILEVNRRNKGVGKNAKADAVTQSCVCAIS